MQPLHLRLLSPLQKTWRHAVSDWQTDHIRVCDKENICTRVFRKVWGKSSTVDDDDGFQVTGLFSLDPSVVAEFVKIEPSKLFEEKRAKE